MSIDCCKCNKTVSHSSCWTNNMCEKAASLSKGTVDTLKKVNVASAVLFLGAAAYHLYNGNFFGGTRGLAEQVVDTTFCCTFLALKYIESAKTCPYNALKNRVQLASKD